MLYAVFRQVISPDVPLRAVHPFLARIEDTWFVLVILLDVEVVAAYDGQHVLSDRKVPVGIINI